MVEIDRTNRIDKKDYIATETKKNLIVLHHTVGKSKRSTREVDWTKPSGILDLKGLDGWQTFYCVESELDDLIEMLSKKKEDTK